MNMKGIFISSLIALLTLPATAQQVAQLPQGSYQELTDTKPIDTQAWNEISAATHVTWGTTDVRYNKTNVPHIKKATQWSATAWKGERINAQAVVWSKEPVANITVKVSDLKGPKGALIPASAIKTNRVGYVMTDELNKDKKGTCGHRPNVADWDSSLVADVLDIAPIAQLAARTVQPFWMNVWVPQATPAGNYTGTFTVSAGDKIIETLKIKLKVLNRTLPAPHDWAFHLDLWQNPFAEARYNDVPLWSDAHLEAMRPTMQILADAGQKIITTSVMHRPWGGQTEDYFATMVNRTKKIDGSWSFDYDIFDKWVSFMLSLGIDKQINCYSLIPWKLSFQYYDQASDQLKSIQTKPGEAAYNEYWGEFLVSFAQHLKAKGWWDITTIGVDERPMKQMQEVIKLIRKADPTYKISLAGLYHPEIEADLQDYSIPYGHNFPKEIKAKRDSQGKTSTFYTCCTEPYPNGFTFSPPAESAWLGWYTAASEYDGYLRWAYNSWTKDPLRDSRFRSFGAGDCYLVYPNGRSSIRMERMVEGFQDFEKIQLLRTEFAAKGDKRKLTKLNKLVESFTHETLTEQGASKMLINARTVLNSL